MGRRRADGFMAERLRVKGVPQSRNWDYYGLREQARSASGKAKTYLEVLRQGVSWGLPWLIPGGGACG